MRIGDKVWLITSSLAEGTVTEVHADFVKVALNDGNEIALPPASVFDNPHMAFAACVQCQHYYWRRQAEKPVDVICASDPDHPQHPSYPRH